MFDLEEKYKEYLEMVGLKLDSMSDFQKQETKRAFFGGMSKLMHTLKFDMLNLTEERELEVLTGINGQINQFWITEEENASKEKEGKG